VKDRDVDLRPGERRNGAPPAARPRPVVPEPAPAAEPPRPAPARAAVAVAEAPRAPQPPAGSRFGPLGALAKRIVARLIRFEVVRQATVDADLAARIDATASDVATLRRDLREAALDFGAIADRMHAFENVRRTVERGASYRREVREHRRQLADAGRQMAALSARVTFLQRESGPVRTGFDALREDVAELGDALAALERFSRETLETGLTEAVSDGRERAAAAADAELRIVKLEHALQADRSASARDLAQRSAELRAVVEGVERRLAATAEQLGAAIRARAAEAEEALEALRAGAEADRAELEERIARAQRTTATLRTAVDGFARETAAERDRSAVADVRAAEAERALNGLTESLEELSARVDDSAPQAALDERISALQRRISDVAGAVNEVRDKGRPAEMDAMRTLLDRVAEELDELRGRLLATPYMSAPPDDWPPLRRSTPDDFDYLGFENVFRGPEAFIRERLRAYLPLVEGHAPVVELGCGRGEFLELLRERGIAAGGVDLSADAVARTRAKGIDGVVEGDANAYLASLPERSVGTIFSAQFAEHLPFAELLRCLELARTRLVPGGSFIAETVNPNSIEGLKTFYVDPSHVKPLFPEVFLFLCRSMGFDQVRLFYPNGGGFEESEPTRRPEYAVVATLSPDESKTGATAQAPNASRRPPTARSR
jgi:SAM-dependent methyltransferase